MSDCQFSPQETISIVFRQGSHELSVECVACPRTGDRFVSADFEGTVSCITWDHMTGSGGYCYPVITVDVTPDKKETA